MSSIYIRWFICSCNLLSLYPTGHFLSMLLSCIMAMMNSNGDRASWEITIWIFASAKLLPSAIIIIIIKFPIYFWFLHQLFTQYLAWKKIGIIYILCNMFFAALFGDIIQSYWLYSYKKISRSVKNNFWHFIYAGINISEFSTPMLADKLLLGVGVTSVLMPSGLFSVFKLILKMIE